MSDLLFWNQLTDLTMAGLLLLISGASGAGKTTLIRRLQKEEPLHTTVSCTTRAPRSGEIDGKDYHFLSETDFLAKVADNQLLEYACVHSNYYGTLSSEVIPYLEKNQAVLIEIDYQGASQIRQLKDPLIQKSLFDVFVLVDPENLRKRLEKRRSDSQKMVELRIQNSLKENQAAQHYQHQLISNTHDDDYAQLKTWFDLAKSKT